MALVNYSCKNLKSQITKVVSNSPIQDFPEKDVDKYLLILSPNIRSPHFQEWGDVVFCEVGYSLTLLLKSSVYVRKAFPRYCWVFCYICDVKILNTSRSFMFVVFFFLSYSVCLLVCLFNFNLLRRFNSVNREKMIPVIFR